jgi:hypothetical protein
MEDFVIVVIWIAIMGIVAIAKMIKRKSDAQNTPEQQAEYRQLAQQRQQQQGGREQRREPVSQGGKHASASELIENVRQRLAPQHSGREPTAHDGKHAAARELIENAIERQAGAAREHAETQQPARPGDQKLPSLTSPAATPTPSVATVRDTGKFRRMLSSKRDIRNAIILREVFDRPRAYDV